MKVTKNAMSISLMVLMVVAITSVVIALPVSAQTISAELKDAWPKWRSLDLSVHPYQILYAKVKNTGTEAIYVKVDFSILDPSGTPGHVVTDVAFLPPRTIRLSATWTPSEFGPHDVGARLYYSADGITWLQNGIKAFDFVVVP